MMNDMQSKVTFASLGYYGELGNQMFQISAVLGYGKKFGKKPMFPDWKCKISGRDYTNVFKKSLPPSDGTIGDGTMFKQIHYMELKYVELPAAEGNVDLVGYYQSENYFDNVKEEVIELFKPADEVKLYIEEKYADLLEYKNKVSLHVRTAKRASNDSDVHACATQEFIEQAMEEFKDKDLFVVFADNMEEAKKILPSGKTYLFIENEENYIDLFLMTYFDSYIVSPSTFGWWGAYLSATENPKITVMKDWFAKDKPKFYLNDNDIIPKSWKKI